MKEQSKKQKANERYLHNERLDSEQEKELWKRSPDNPINKLTLAEKGFHFIIGKNAPTVLVNQFLIHA